MVIFMDGDLYHNVHPFIDENGQAYLWVNLTNSYVMRS